MDRVSADLDPDIHTRFLTTTRRAARSRRRRRIGATVAVAAVAAISVAVAPAAWDALHGTRTSGPASTIDTTPFPIPSGSYTVTIRRADALAAGVASGEVEGFAGTYVFTFYADGTYIWELATPSFFVKDGGGGTTSHVGSLITFPDWLRAASGDDVTVRVRVSAPSIEFIVERATPSDAAPFARALFASKPWTATG